MSSDEHPSCADDEQKTTFGSIALAVLFHVAVYFGGYVYYGSHPTFDCQTTNPELQPVTVSNIPGLVTITGPLALTVVPLIWESFEWKRKNPQFWGNVDANLWNSVVSVPTMILCLEWICKSRMYLFSNAPVWSFAENWRPILMDTTIFLFLADTWFYWTHRLAHVVPWLWKFHVLHHKLNPAKSVSAIAAASTSAVDLTLTHLPMFWMPFLLRKFCFESVCLSLLYMMTWLPFIHSFSFWPYDTMVLMDPTNHRVHHSWGRTNNYNFAAFTCFWDRLMGTYRSEAEMKAAWQRGEKEEVAAPFSLGGKKQA